jgi:hypothetical protein
MTIRELVSLIITGCADTTAAGLLLRILEPAGLALMAECASFTKTINNTFIGTLDLSDAALADEFLGDDARKQRTFILRLWSGADKNLIIDDRVQIMNNPLTAAVQAATPTGV